MSMRALPKFLSFSLLGIVLSGALVTPVLADAITAGNLVIYRVGTGAAALGSTATSVFLDEYTTSGTLVQSIALPNTGASALTAVGNSSTEGVISRSQDGLSLVFTGYRKDAGGTSPASDAPGTTARVIGTIGLSGLANTSIALTDPANAIRSATTVDGTTYYISTAAGVRYVGTPSGAATSVLIDSRNSRQVTLSGNVVYASNGSTSITNKVQSYGVLPTGATTPTPIVSQLLGDAVNGIAFFDLNAGVAGDDTLYLLNTFQGQLRKFTFDGSAWNASGSLATSAVNLTGVAEGGIVNLFLTTGGNLLGLTDASGYNADLTGTPSILATAGENTAFRGVGVLVPEPSTYALGALALGIVLAMRRRRA